MMGSHIEVNSVLGEGSRFSFRLVQRIVDSAQIGEFSYEQQSVKNATLHHVSIVAPKASVLIVDDNEVNIKVLTGLLAPTKILVDSANSGPQGLRMAASKKYDLIFMDHLMPDMDGVEAFHELRNDLSSASKDSPCVILTANALHGAKDFYENEGFDAFLTKPVSLRDVEKVLVELLPEYLISEKTDVINDAYDEEAISEDLPDLPGVDWNKAIACTGSKDALVSTISDFVTVTRSNLAILEDDIAKKDYNDFKIKIHALKGLAATIGAVCLSELARLLEYAARDGEYDKIDSLYPVFKEEIFKYKDTMKKELLPSDEKPLMENTDMLIVLLQMLKGSLQMNDIDMSDKYVGQINNYSYPDKIKDKIDDLVVFVTNLDNVKALEVIDVVLEVI